MKKTRQNKRLEPGSDLIRTDKVPGARNLQAKPIGKNLSRYLPEWQPRRCFEITDRLRRVKHLDRGHAHLARRLQVDAEVVEIDAMPGIDAERLGHHAVNARVGLA